MNIKNKASTIVSNLKLHWKNPPLGRNMNYKSIVGFSLGGIGVKFIIYCVQNMVLCVGNFLIGNSIGIQPKPMYIIYLLSILASFPLTGLRATIIDNTRSKKGKYRPYIISMGIPTSILGVAFVWMPYENMTELWKCVVVLAFNIGFQFFYMFFYDVYDNMINVLSSNTQERADVCAVKTVTDSMASSIANLIIPLIAKAITGQNTLFDIRIYRYAYPPMIIIGMLLAIVVYASTKEKIVQAKTHIVQIKFIDAFRAVAKNKYFWIISLAGWIGFLEASYTSVLSWLYSYQSACTAGQYSFIVTIYGNASFWGILAAPFLIKKFGKRNVLIFTNFLNIIFIGLMYPAIKYVDPTKVIWVILCCLWLNAVVGAFAHVLTPSLNGDIRDYQQYITGERIDGMFATVGLVGSVITLLTGSVLPEIYDKCGINTVTAAKMGFTNVYDVLYDKGIFDKTIGVLIAASVIGALLNVIPYFFYDLTETRQKGMIQVLHIRSLFEDFGNDALSDEDLVSAIEIVNEAKKFANAERVDESKASIKSAKKTHIKADIKAAKKEHSEAIEYNRKIQISKFVLDEMNKFSTLEVQTELSVAKSIREAGLSRLADIDNSILSQARGLPQTTHEEKLYRKKQIESAKRRIQSKKLIKKNYPDGLVKFDRSIFDELFAQEDKVDMELDVAYKILFESRKNKDRDSVKQLKSEISVLRLDKRIVKAKIKKATTENSIYNRAAKPYLDAKRLMIEDENYRHYDEIAAQYGAAKERVEEAKRLKIEKEKQFEEEKAAYAKKLKAEKLRKKN